MNHLELINDRLAYFGDHAPLQQTIVETIARLPDEVAEFALERCRFISVGESLFGVVLPGRIGVDHYRGRPAGHYSEALPADNWIIVLADPLPDEGAHSIVAHEIAHAWRGDDRLGNPPDDCEEATARLTAEWGFSGLGADAEYCSGGFRGHNLDTAES